MVWLHGFIIWDMMHTYLLHMYLSQFLYCASYTERSCQRHSDILYLFRDILPDKPLYIQASHIVLGFFSKTVAYAHPARARKRYRDTSGDAVLHDARNTYHLRNYRNDRSHV